MGVFGWPDGEYAFDPASPVISPSIDPIDTVELIIEAVGKVVPTPLCERFLTQYPGQVLKSSERMTTYLTMSWAVFFACLYLSNNSYQTWLKSKKGGKGAKGKVGDHALAVNLVGVGK